MGQFDSMSAPPRRPLFGAIADVLGKVNEYANKPDPTMPGGLANPPLSAIANALAIPGLAKTADRMSYGEPLTNGGAANVPFFKPETVDAAMAVAPLAGPMLRGTGKVATGASNALVRGITGNPEATAGRVIDYAQNMLPGNAATVWHGSPHKFSAFDASKIGTGEGAQAYGHGLYLAESPAVAGQYKSALSGPATTEVGGAPIDSLGLSANAKAFVNQVAGSLQRGGKMDDEIAGLELNIKYGHPDAAAMREALAVLRKGVDRGNLYKVDLPDEHIAKMLDWDKPLSQQAPGVLEAARKAMPPRFVAGRYVDPYSTQVTGQALLDQLRMLANAGPAGLRTPEAALGAAGVPGIRYLDGGSRGAGTGSSNFVVFPGNEGLLSILERNGQPVR